MVAAAASDWTLAQIMPVFSTTMACFGVSCAVLGRAGLYEKLGPRVTGVLGAGLYLSSFSVGALAVELHSLPLLYLGCGIMGGITMGITYVPPISTLIKWFPDRKVRLPLTTYHPTAHVRRPNIVLSQHTASFTAAFEQKPSSQFVFPLLLYLLSPLFPFPRALPQRSR